jgi:hypothetical protein
MTGEIWAATGGMGAGQTRAAPLLRAHWDSLRDGATLPARDRINPRHLAPVLAHIFLIEQRGAGPVHFRIAGMAVNAVQGEDLTDAPFAALFEAVARTQVLDAVAAVLAGQRTLEMALHSERGLLRPPLLARLTLLPFARVLDDRAQAIGCLETHGPVTLPPRRFRVERLLGEALEMAGSAGIRPPISPVVLRVVSDRGLAE